MNDTKQKPQIERFREKARELETDDAEDAFEAIVRKIAKSPQKTGDKPKKKTAK